MTTTGLDILIKGASAQDQALGYDAAVVDGLLGWWFLGGSLEKSVKNWSGSTDAVVAGSPTVEDYYLQLKSGTNYLELPFSDGAEGTMIIVARGNDTYADAAHRPVFWGSGGNAGALLSVASGASLSLTVYESLTESISGKLTSHVSSPGDWRMLICDFSEADQHVYNPTLATSNTTARTSGAVRVPGTNPLRIGSAQNGASLQGICDVAMAAYYSRQIIPDERSALYNQVKAYMGRRSISV